MRRRSPHGALSALLWTSLLLVTFCALPAEAQRKKKKKLSLAEIAALEWKLEQGTKTATQNPDPEARKKAVQELQELGDARAAKPLALALKEDPSAEVRKKAAEALHALQSPEAMGVLQLAAKADPDSGVRQTCAELLKKFPRRMKPAALPLKARPFKEPEGKVDAKLIKKTLASPSGDARLWAIQQIGKVKFGGRVKLLKEHLAGDPSGRVRVEAAKLLAELQKDKALPDLIRLLADGDPAVRFELARILAEFDDPGALSVVQKLAEGDANETVREEAKDLLEPSTPVGKRLLKERIKKLSSANPAERIEGLDSLVGYTHWRAMVPMSCALLSDESVLVRTKAVQVLPQMHDASVLTALRVAAVSEPDPKLIKTVRRTLMGMVKQVQKLVKQLQKGNEAARVKAARALGQAAYPNGMEALIGALKDESAKVRRQAVLGLRNFDDPKVTEALKGASADKDKRVRQAVDRYFKKQARLERWRKFYTDYHRVTTWTVDKDPVKRADAAIALGISGETGAQHALTLLLATDKVEQVRLYAAWSLVLMGTEVAEKALRKAAEKDKSEKVRLTCRKYLVIAKVSRDDLVQQLRDDKASVRRDAAEALSLMANSQVLGALVSATLCDPDPAVRAATLRGLARVSNPLARTVIKLTMTRDPDKRVRRTAMVMHILTGGK